MTRGFNLVVAFLLLVIGGPYYWLMLDTTPNDVPAWKLDLAELRRLAESIPGQKPVKVTVDAVAWDLAPGNVMIAGYGIKRRMNAVLSFQLERPGLGPILIGTGISKALSRQGAMDGFNPAAQASIDAAMHTASLILATGPDSDQLGGLAELTRGSGSLAAVTSARLNPSQVPSKDEGGPAFWAHGLSVQPRLSGRSPEAVAPGVVAVPTDSPVPGEQLIYVRLASGTEYLFTGDTAPFRASWAQQRPRSRLMTDILHPEDRALSIGWLKAIFALHQAAPGLHVIPGRDFDWIQNPDSHSGVIGKATFSNGAAPSDKDHDGQ